MGSRVKLDLNPRFVYLSPNRDVAADARAVMEHVDHAIIALDGRAPVGGDCCVEQLNPAAAGSTLRVELWVNDLDDYTCTYGFLVSDAGGHVPVARGERTVVSIDPASMSRAKWSGEFLASHTRLLRDLPAYG